MQIPKVLRGNVAVIGTVLLWAALGGTQAWGQVDQQWLKSWNQALDQKPERVASHGRIASGKEPGTPLVIHGFVAAPDGTAADGVLVHAYHRDNDGVEFYPNSDSRSTWKLQGWVRTDAEGRFEFRTIRPAPDDLGREGAHIHFTLVSDDHGRQWAPKVFFSDDPMVTDRQRRSAAKAGEFGWLLDARTVDGIQHIDVRLRLEKQADF